MLSVDNVGFAWYSLVSDRVADTCEACDQGNSRGNSFFTWEIENAKPFLTYEQQITLLKNKELCIISMRIYVLCSWSIYCLLKEMSRHKAFDRFLDLSTPAPARLKVFSASLVCLLMVRRFAAEIITVQ